MFGLLVSCPIVRGFGGTTPVRDEEVLRLYNKLKSFEQFQDQNLHDNYYEKYNALHKYDKSFIKQDQGLLENIKTLMSEHQQTPFVRYQTALDLDNNGKTTDTVIKTIKDTDYSNNILNINNLFIVDDKLQRVDEAEMTAFLPTKKSCAKDGVRQGDRAMCLSIVIPAYPRA